MYIVNGESYDSFLCAVATAKKNNCDVIEAATGLRRWTPAPKPSPKKIAYNAERHAAYAAYQRSIQNETK